MLPLLVTAVPDTDLVLPSRKLVVRVMPPSGAVLVVVEPAPALCTMVRVDTSGRPSPSASGDFLVVVSPPSDVVVSDTSRVPSLDERVTLVVSPSKSVLVVMASPVEDR